MWAKKGEKKALLKQIKAYKSLEPVDIAKLKDLATTTDKENLANRLASQREVDPAMAALRAKGASGLLAGLEADRAGGASADALASASADEASKGQDTSGLISQLIEQARQDLAAGATLPPELQGELVRSGLESATSDSLGSTGQGVAGTRIRTLLGGAGLALRQQRQQSAQQAVSTADALKSSRQQRLAQIVGLDQNIRQGNASRAGAATAAGQSVLPGGGIEGGDAANLFVDNTNFRNQVKLALANLGGQKNILNAQKNIGYMNAGNKMAQGVVGSMTGTGMLGGMGG
jgi:hypothetical protein